MDTVAEPVAELLFEQKLGAMQIIAALVLTDEEGRAICESMPDDCQPDPEWIASMRKELLSPFWRAQLMAALKTQGFRTNTHPGFALGGLTDAPSDPWAMNEAYQCLEGLLRAYVEGVGDTVDPDDKAAFWTARLVEAGHSPEVVEWVFRSGGLAMAAEAGMKRLLRKKA